MRRETATNCLGEERGDNKENPESDANADRTADGSTGPVTRWRRGRIGVEQGQGGRGMAGLNGETLRRDRDGYVLG